MAEQQQARRGEHVPWVVSHLTGPWHRRHPRVFVGMELLVAAWLVTLGAILSAEGYWEGALLFLGAALLLWFLYLFERSVHL